MEYPPLVAGQSARFAVHFTAMGPSFKAVRAGSVNVVLEREGKEQTFTATGPSRPGIFGVDVKPDSAGAYSMTVRLRSSNLTDSHSLGSVTVHPDAASASAEKPGKAQEETIAFLKEQQWSLDFATAPVVERSGHESFVVAGQIQPRAGGQAEVTAPIDGRLVEAFAVPVGATVARGQISRVFRPPSLIQLAAQPLSWPGAKRKTRFDLRNLMLRGRSVCQCRSRTGSSA